MTDFALTDIVQGDTVTFRLAITRDGSPLSIIGATFEFNAKRWKTDLTTLIHRDDDAFVIEDQDNGIVLFTLDPEDTEVFTDDVHLNCNIRMTESNGRKTTFKGTMDILLDIDND